MSYITASLTSFDELRTAIKGACVNAGWQDLGNQIVAKSGLYVQLDSLSTGVVAYVGTGESAGALTGASNPSGARLGRVSPGTRFPVVTWPATAHIFVLSDPVEVYVVLNFNVDHHYWMSFGKSDIPGLLGSGNWFAGCASPAYTIDGYNDGSIGYKIGADEGKSSAEASTGPWWFNQISSNLSYNSHGIQTGLDGLAWSCGYTGVGLATGLYALSGLPQGPNAWNGDSPLLPIAVFVNRGSAKVSLAMQCRHARYVRVDNYVPGQIITLGHEQWMIFPFAKKNTAQRNGAGASAGLPHTGTFGWAIRYLGTE